MAAMHPSSKYPAEQDDDSEWEYEYHETETETFYVTLDLSSTSTTSRTKKKPKTSAPVAVPLPPTTPASSPDPISESTQTPQIPEVTPRPTPELQGDPTDRIQILDFHTTSPLISYQNQLYTCTWTSTIGTDLLLTPPDPTSTLPKLKEGKTFDILATTSIKLVGKPTQLVPRNDPHTSHAPSPAPDPETSETSPAPGTPNANDERIEQPATGVTRIDLGPNPSPSRQNQAHFLSRLIAAKAKRGETDSVPVHSKKVLTGTGWRAQQRERAMERAGQRQEGGEGVGEGGSGLMLEEQDSNGDLEAGAPAQSRGGRVRSRVGRPRTRGLRWRTGDTASSITGRGQEALFADARSGSGDREGTEGQGGATTGMSTPTPRTWDELGQGERSGAGATIIAPTVDVDMAGAEGNGSVEARPVDATIAASSGDSSSAPPVVYGAAPEGGDIQTDRGSGAEAALDAPDVDILMEDAP